MREDDKQPPRGAMVRLKDVSQMTPEEIHAYARELHIQVVESLQTADESRQMPGMAEHIRLT